MQTVSMSLQGNRIVMESTSMGVQSVCQYARVFMKFANRRCGPKQELISGPDSPCGSGFGSSEHIWGWDIGGMALWKDKGAA